jgi:hypothetical protein
MCIKQPPVMAIVRRAGMYFRYVLRVANLTALASSYNPFGVPNANPNPGGMNKYNTPMHRNGKPGNPKNDNRRVLWPFSSVKTDFNSKFALVGEIEKSPEEVRWDFDQNPTQGAMHEKLAEDALNLRRQFYQHPSNFPEGVPIHFPSQQQPVVMAPYQQPQHQVALPQQMVQAPVVIPREASQPIVPPVVVMEQHSTLPAVHLPVETSQCTPEEVEAWKSDVLVLGKVPINLPPPELRR